MNTSVENTFVPATPHSTPLSPFARPNSEVKPNAPTSVALGTARLIFSRWLLPALSYRLPSAGLQYDPAEWRGNAEVTAFSCMGIRRFSKDLPKLPGANVNIYINKT